MMVVSCLYNIPLGTRLTSLSLDSCSPDAEDDTGLIQSPKMTSIAAAESTSSSAEKEPQLVSDNELPNLEVVTPKMADISLQDEAKPAASTASDEEEFHEASESVSLVFFSKRLDVNLCFYSLLNLRRRQQLLHHRLLKNHLLRKKRTLKKSPMKRKWKKK